MPKLRDIVARYAGRSSLYGRRPAKRTSTHATEIAVALILLKAPGLASLIELSCDQNRRVGAPPPSTIEPSLGPARFVRIKDLESQPKTGNSHNLLQLGYQSLSTGYRIIFHLWSPQSTATTISSPTPPGISFPKISQNRNDLCGLAPQKGSLFVSLRASRCS